MFVKYVNPWRDDTFFCGNQLFLMMMTTNSMNALPIAIFIERKLCNM